MGRAQCLQANPGKLNFGVLLERAGIPTRTPAPRKWFFLQLAVPRLPSVIRPRSKHNRLARSPLLGISGPGGRRELYHAMESAGVALGSVSELLWLEAGAKQAGRVSWGSPKAVPLSLLLAGITVDFEPVEEGRYDFRVELRAGVAAYLAKGIPEDTRTPANHIVKERLSYGNDSRSQRNHTPSQPPWMTRAVVSLMVVPHDALNADLFQRLQYLRAPCRVAFHEIKLLRRQKRGLGEQGGRHMDFAHIVYVQLRLRGRQGRG